MVQQVEASGHFSQYLQLLILFLLFNAQFEGSDSIAKPTSILFCSELVVHLLNVRVLCQFFFDFFLVSNHLLQVFFLTKAVDFLIPVFNAETTRCFVEAQLLFLPASLLCTLVKLPVYAHKRKQIECVIGVWFILNGRLNAHLALLFIVTPLLKDQVLVHIVMKLSKLLFALCLSGLSGLSPNF